MTLSLSPLTLPNAFGISFMLHLMVVAILLLTPQWSTPRPKVVPDFQVNLVAPLEKVDLSTGMAQRKHKGTEAPKRPLVTPVSTPTKTPVAAPTTPAPAPTPIAAPTPAPAKMAVPGKTPPVVDTKKEEAQMNKALEQLRQVAQKEELERGTREALNKLVQTKPQTTPQKGSPEPKASTEPAMGQGVGPRTGERDTTNYLAAISAIIQQNFKSRVDFSHQNTRDPVVRFTLRRDGTVVPDSITIETSSGSTVIDRSLVLAVQRGNPYKPFPPTIDRPSITINVKGNLQQ